MATFNQQLARGNVSARAFQGQPPPHSPRMGSSISRTSKRENPGTHAPFNASDSSYNLDDEGPSDDSEGGNAASAGRDATPRGIWIVSRPLSGKAFSTTVNAALPLPFCHWAVGVGGFVYELQIGEDGSIYHKRVPWNPSEWSTKFYVGKTILAHQ